MYHKRRHMPKQHMAKSREKRVVYQCAIWCSIAHCHQSMLLLIWLSAVLLTCKGPATWKGTAPIHRRSDSGNVVSSRDDDDSDDRSGIDCL
jgi:hypothetical protein